MLCGFAVKKFNFVNAHIFMGKSDYAKINIINNKTLDIFKMPLTNELNFESSFRMHFYV